MNAPRMLSSYPKIELHVHLEGAISPQMLLDVAKRNDVALPVRSVAELRDYFRFRDFDHFIAVWYATVTALRTERDFRELVVDYARRAQAQGAVYLEGIFSPCEHVGAGATWDEVFSGFCDGAAQAREEVGVEIRLTPDIARGVDLEMAVATAEAALRYRHRGVVALGLGGPEADYPPELYSRAFEVARAGGLASAPHAGEVAGTESVRGALDVLYADRLRHGVRAVEDPGLVREIAARGVVCDVCVLSNLRLGVVDRLQSHPLPSLLEAGVRCTVNTDDPSFFDCDLVAEHRAALGLGADPRVLYEAGVAGALCDAGLRAQLRSIGKAYDWASLA